MKLNIKIPQTLSDISIDKFMKFQAIDFKDKQELEFFNVKVLSIFYGIPFETMQKMKATDVDMLVNEVVKVLNQKAEHQLKFEFEGIKYGFIPCLEEISYGELIDLEKTRKINEMMAILYRPIIKETEKYYAIESYSGSEINAEKFKKLGVDLALGALNFFLDISTDCMNYSLEFLKMKVDTQIKKEPTLVTSGTGILQSLKSLKETYSNLTRLLNYPIRKS
jgi:hypothetical protein